jgi:PAS domain S-box-containing protein
LPPEEVVTRLAAIIDCSYDAIIGRDEHGFINTWNSAATRIFGYPAEEIVGESGLLLVPPDMHEEELSNLDRLRKGEHIEHHETQRLRKGGQRVNLYAALSPISDSSGRFLGSAFTARDLGAQQREHAARSRLAAIFECSDDAIIVKDLNGVVTDWNAAAERIFGYTPEEMVGRSILTIIPPELQYEEPMLLGRIRNGERIEHYETYRLHKSGKRVDVSLGLSPIRDGRGRIVGASKIARDISERLRLDQERVLLAAIVDSSEDAIISKTLDGVITSWNTAAQRIFGYHPEEIIGHSVLRLIPPELYFEEPQIISRLRKGERIEHFETRRRRKNGELFDISLTVSPIKDAKGQVVGASKIVRDITDRKAAEAALIEKEKLVATGRMAATLAHEVNNPLESITNLAYLLANHMQLDVQAQRYAELLLKEAQRAGDITRQTLSYHRASRVESQVNIVELLEDVLRSKARKLAGKNLYLQKLLTPVPLIRGYAGELRQVFENIIENAIDALPSEGTIWVRTRLLGQGDTQRVAVSLGDNGAGMPRFVMAKIFDPFFTTKLQTGSGLGLWVARGIVQKHDGVIRARTRGRGIHHGSVFTVTLPLRHGPPASSEATKNSSPAM